MHASSDKQKLPIDYHFGLKSVKIIYLVERSLVYFDPLFWDNNMNLTPRKWNFKLTVGRKVCKQGVSLAALAPGYYPSLAEVCPVTWHDKTNHHDNSLRLQVDVEKKKGHGF